MNCKNCNAEIAANAKFCPECGAKVIHELICSKCGEKLAANAKFCLECGTKTGEQLEKSSVNNGGEKENPEVRAHIDKGDGFVEKEKYQKAIDEYTLALKIEPENTEALIDRGIAYTRNNEYGKSRVDLKKCLRLAENDPAFEQNKNDEDFMKGMSLVYDSLGDTYYFEDKYGKSIQFYEKSIEYYDENANAYMDCGFAYLLDGNAEEAEEKFERAVKLDPDLEDTIENFKSNISQNAEENFGFQYDESTDTISGPCPYCEEITEFSRTKFDGDSAISLVKNFAKGYLNPIEGLSTLARTFLGGDNDDTEYASTFKCNACEKKVVLCLNCDAAVKYSIKNDHAICKECGTDCGELT